MTDSPIYLGVDGGGTGCRARIETAGGEVLGRGTAGPATLRQGIDTGWAAIMAAAAEAIAEAGLSQDEVRRLHTGVGVAGIGRGGAAAAMAAHPHPFGTITFLSDAMAACLGAHGGADGGIVIAGTGSIGIARVAGRDLRIGGYGFPASDEGSGAGVGLHLLRLALNAHDGLIETTPLLAEAMRHCGGVTTEVVAWMDRASATDYASLAPLVLRHAALGDIAAHAILQDVAAALSGLIRALVARGAPRVTLLGGLAEPLEPWLAPDIRALLSPALADAVSGAILAAKVAAKLAQVCDGAHG